MESRKKSFRVGTSAAISGVLALSAPAAAQTCALDLSRPIIIPRNPKDPADTEKRAYRLADGAVVFVGRLTIDADGHPRAYGPRGTGLDDLGNAGRPGNWWGLATDRRDCGPTGTPILQQAGDPAPGFFVSKTTMTAGTGCRRQDNYVHSGKIPYVALPPAIAKIARNQGRLAVVHNPAGRATAFAVHADGAPPFGIGEGSMALARRLGLSDNPRRGGMNGRGLIYIVLPRQTGFPRDAADVDSRAQAAFTAWGGPARLAACRAAVERAPR